MVGEIFKTVERRMKKTLEAIGRELGKIRTGRASLSILDGIQVEYYGTPTPLAQVARLSVPEANMILVQPWETGVLQAIEREISKADLGLNPINDGKLLRVPIPTLTEERRKELAKKVAQLGEEGKTEIRHHRREGNDDVKKLKDGNQISEDEERQAHNHIQELTNKFDTAMDKLAKNKEKEILTV